MRHFRADRRLIECLRVISNPMRLPGIGREQRQSLLPQVFCTPKFPLALCFACLFRELCQPFGVYEGMALIADDRTQREVVATTAAVPNQIRRKRSHKLLLVERRAVGK